MILEFRPEALEDGFFRFFDLKEQRSAIAAHEQADGAERTDASHPDDFEGDVLERVALEETTPLRGKAVLVAGEYALRIHSIPRVTLCRAMMDDRRAVVSPRQLSSHRI